MRLTLPLLKSARRVCHLTGCHRASDAQVHIKNLHNGTSTVHDNLSARAKEFDVSIYVIYLSLLEDSENVVGCKTTLHFQGSCIT